MMTSDAFATSSLSSVVSSLACTDNGISMSIASNSHYSMAHSVNDNAMSTPGNTSQQWDFAQHESKDDEDEEEDEAHIHMNIPMGGASNFHSNNSAHSGIMAQGSHGENFDANFRRPRFYSVGSTGSW